MVDKIPDPNAGGGVSPTSSGSVVTSTASKVKKFLSTHNAVAVVAAVAVVFILRAIFH